MFWFIFDFCSRKQRWRSIIVKHGLRHSILSHRHPFFFVVDAAAAAAAAAAAFVVVVAASPPGFRDNDNCTMTVRRLQPEDARRLQAIYEANPVLQDRMLERMKAAQKAAEPYVPPKLESYAEPASKSRCVRARGCCVCMVFFSSKDTGGVCTKCVRLFIKSNGLP